MRLRIRKADALAVPRDALTGALVVVHEALQAQPEATRAFLREVMARIDCGEPPGRPASGRRGRAEDIGFSRRRVGWSKGASPRPGEDRIRRELVAAIANASQARPVYVVGLMFALEGLLRWHECEGARPGDHPGAVLFALRLAALRMTELGLQLPPTIDRAFMERSLD